MKKKIVFKNQPPLMEEIKKVLKTMSYGSVELYVTKGEVTQMTVRRIVKTRYNIDEESAKSDIKIRTIQINKNQTRTPQTQNRVLTNENQSSIKD